MINQFYPSIGGGVSSGGGGSGDVTLAGNNSFTGNNSHSGIETFSGSVVMAISSVPLPANTGRAITSDDFGKNLTVNAGSDQTFSTPDSATSPDGAEFFMTAYGVGNPIMSRAGTDTVDLVTSIKMTSKRKRYRFENCVAETNWQVESLGDWE